MWTEPARLSVAGVEALLDLLNGDAGADPDDVQRVLDDEGLDPAVERSLATRVQRIRAHLHRAERRRDELAALFASSRELAEQRELDPLLRRLTQRAHDLLGVDLTWLTEIEPDSGESVVKTATGTVSLELEGLRTQRDRGLAWFVAAQRRPHSAPRYHDDQDFRHDTGADRVLDAEGVISVLAVPLIAGEEVIGTLFVAVRHEREFHADQVALLTALADHAAAMLQGARLLAQARSLAEEAEASRRQLGDHVHAMERAHTAYAELTNCVLRGEDAAEVAATLERAVQRRVITLDDEGAPPSGVEVDYPDDQCRRQPSVAVALGESRRTGRFVTIASRQFAGVVAVVSGGAFLGGLLIAEGKSTLGPVEQKTVEDAARIMALLRLKQDALAQAEERVRGELLCELVDSEDGGLDELRMRARARGLNLDDLKRVLVLNVDPAKRGDALHVAASLFRKHGLVAEHAGAVVMALDASEHGDVHWIWQHVRSRLNSEVLVVEAPHAATSRDVPARYREARRCLSLLPALGVTDRGTTTAPYGLYARLFEPNTPDIDDFVEATIGPLVRRDHGTGSEFVRTVSTFAECHASTTKTARALHLHPNTVLQRLERIDKLLGEQWRQPDTFFRVQVAARIHALRQPVIAGAR